MRLTVLTLPESPGAALLRERLEIVLPGRDDIEVAWREVADEDEAAALGMRGSPTLLVDGTDPFAAISQPGGRSCRIYRDETRAPENAPSLVQLRRALSAATPGRPPISAV